MLTTNRTLILLGGSGFIGKAVIRRAVAAGWNVRVLVRSDDAAKTVSALGGSPFIGDAERPDTWIGEVRGARAIVDLIQPKLPKRLGRRAVLGIASKRQEFTKLLLAALGTLTPDERPLFISVSGIDDLSPDGDGNISGASSIRSQDYGFNPIGIPVRRLIEQSGVGAAFVYFSTVYGPGKAFAETIFPSIAKGTWKNFGRPSDRIALIHVEDAARGLVHIAGLEPSAIAGRSFVLSDGCALETNAFFDAAAAQIGVSRPGRVPQWLASIVAGPAAVETITCNAPVTFAPSNFPDDRLEFPSYREGLTATLATLGYVTNIRKAHFNELLR